MSSEQAQKLPTNIIMLCMQNFFQVWFLCPSFGLVLLKELMFVVFITLSLAMRLKADDD